MGAKGFRYRGRFYSRFLYFFMRHYLIFTCPNGSAAVSDADISDSTPRGPEYWGDLEESFKTGQNREAAQNLNGRGLITAAIILSLVIMAVAAAGMIAGSVFFIGQLSDGVPGSVAAVMIFAIFGLFFLAALIAALCNSKDCFAPYDESTTISQLNRTHRMLKAATAGTCVFAICGVGIIVVVLNAVAMKRVKQLKTVAESYWKERGLTEDELKERSLGELYTKLDKYGEFIAYTKANNK